MKRLLLTLVIVISAVAGFLAVRASPTNEPVTLENHGNHYTVRVELEHATPGSIEANVTVEPTSANSVSLFATMPQMGHSTPEIVARQQRAGRFVARGELFTMSGAWELAVRVQGNAGTEVVRIAALVAEG